MFLSIATTHRPATDLGFLLHKHPDRLHESELSFGRAYLFYPEANEERCEAALVLDVDPVRLVRGGAGGSSGLQDQYVNDRPYAASSFLSVALSRMLRTAMGGASRERPELAASDLALEARVTPLPARGGERLVHELFEPLGWTVEAESIGEPPSRYISLRLHGRQRLSALLNHLYVLIPVLDDDKHYWVGRDEIEKLLQRGVGWLEQHPARELIGSRYLKHQRSLTRAALARLLPEGEEEEDTTEPGAPRNAVEEQLEAPIRLADQRADAVIEALRIGEVATIADLGCGEGKLIARLARERWVTKLVGVDASLRSLEFAARRLKLNEAGSPPESRVVVLHGALGYRDRRWAGVDAAVLAEVVEHIDPGRLPAAQRIVFGEARPRLVIVTTPNREYNALFPRLEAGGFRHPDHRFEWTRAEFRTWAGATAEAFGYGAAFSDIGAVNTELGAPTQMAVFRR
jgi:3' terminal RNA ribose 2'-O-methyltransferase Hen1